MNIRQSAANELSNEQIQVLLTGKFDGAFKISEILKSYNLNCFNYKLISSETIQKWSKLQEELKSKAIDIHTLPNMTLGKYSNGKMSIEDIVRTYKKL